MSIKQFLMKLEVGYYFQNLTVIDTFLHCKLLYITLMGNKLWTYLGKHQIIALNFKLVDVFNKKETNIYTSNCIWCNIFLVYTGQVTSHKSL